MREFTRVLDVREVLVVSDDRNRVWGALEVLLPFREGKDDCKEFFVVDIVVTLGWEESL